MERKDARLSGKSLVKLIGRDSFRIPSARSSCKAEFPPASGKAGLPAPMDEEARRHLADRFFHEAYRLQMKGQFSEAVELYKKSIESFPTAEAHTFLGWTYHFMG